MVKVGTLSQLAWVPPLPNSVGTHIRIFMNFYCFIVCFSPFFIYVFFKLGHVCDWLGTLPPKFHRLIVLRASLRELDRGKKKSIQPRNYTVSILTVNSVSSIKSRFFACNKYIRDFLVELVGEICKTDS